MSREPDGLFGPAGSQAMPPDVRSSRIPYLPAPSLDAPPMYHVERLAQSFPARRPPSTRRLRTDVGSGIGPTMVSMLEARRLALSLPETTEEDHHGIPSFRVRGKIFATVPDDDHLRVMLDADATHAAVREDPAACEELWWGKRLSGVCVRLAQADHRRLAELLNEAWRRKAPSRLLTAGYGAPESVGSTTVARGASGRAGGSARGGTPSARRAGPGR